MKLMICGVSDFKPRWGGIAEATDQIPRFFQAAGHQVCVVGVDEPGAAEFDAAAPYPVYRISPDRKKWKAALQALVEKEAPDILQVNVLGSAWRECYSLARKRRIPLTLFVYGTDVTRKFSLAQQVKVRLSLHLTDAIFSCSHYTRQFLIDHGVKKKHLYVMSTSIPDDYASSPKDASITQGISLEGRRIVLTVCRLVPRKGVDYSLEAFANIAQKYPDTVYLVGGTGAIGAVLKKRVEELHLEDRVHFVGNVTESQKHYLYSICDLFVMPNRELGDGDVEGFGTTFLEAAAYGKPVIGGRSGGTVEAIDDGRTGYLVDSTKISSIQEALEQLLGQPEKARAMGEAGKERAISQFGYRTTIQSYIRHLQEIQKDF